MLRALWRTRRGAALSCVLLSAALCATARAEDESLAENPYISGTQRALTLHSNVCSMCHGARGISKWSFIPSLAGMDKAYLIDQLKSMRGRDRADHFAQAAMWGHAANLTDDEIEALADLFSRFPTPAGSSAGSADVALGKKVFDDFAVGRPACTTCHFNGRGNKDLPRLAGQHADYLTRTLREFRAGFRVNGTMTVMAARLSDAEIEAVAAYLSSLNVPNGDPSDSDFPETASSESPVERGRALFKRVGCFQCHGEEGKGGVLNANAQGGHVPTLTLVSQGYSDPELKAKIHNGVRYLVKADSNGPMPPLFMPTWGRVLTDRQIDDIVAYLKSLAGTEKKDDW